MKIILVLITLIAVASAFDYTDAGISDIQSAIKLGYTTCRRVVDGYLRRIAQADEAELGAIISVNPNATREAEALDQFWMKNHRFKGRLHCAPLIAKDNIDVRGIATTNGLNAFKNQIPQKDATAVKNCKDQGAIFIAKANMSPLADKEAWGHSETGGLTRNPYALQYTTYGSSGGNGAGVAARLAVGGLATETGVSINLPSSANALVGIRPPLNLLKAANAREGVLPNSLYMDVVGPIAKSVEDAVLILDGMIGKEGEYSSSSFHPRGLENLKINAFELLAYDSFPLSPVLTYSVDQKIKQLFSEATHNMTKANAIVKNVTVNFQAVAPSIFNMLGIGTSSCQVSWRNEYFTDRARFSSPAYTSFEQVVAAKKLPVFYQTIWESLLNESKVIGQCTKESQAFEAGRSALIENALELILAGADLVIWPTLPEFPAMLGKDAFARDWGSPTAPTTLVLLASWSGYPSLTVPLGFSEPTRDAPQGLPIGLFMMSKPTKLRQLLRAAYGFQDKFGLIASPKCSSRNQFC